MAVFDPVLAVPPAEGVRVEPATEPFGSTGVGAGVLRAVLDRFPESERRRPL